MFWTPNPGKGAKDCMIIRLATEKSKKKNKNSAFSNEYHADFFPA
jgi:hypothetical protein